MTRFKLDENLPHEALQLLDAAGHDALTVAQQKLAGRSDPEILDVCLAEHRVLVTLDLDFADIRLYPTGSHAGIWVLRPVFQSIRNVLALVRAGLGTLDAESCENRLWIIEPRRVRIRE